MAGIADDPGAEVIVADLARDITRLPLGEALTIAEFRAHGVTVWTVRPDSCGTPRVRYREHEWADLRGWGGRLDEAELLDRLRPQDASRIVLARTGAARAPDPAQEPEQPERDADRAFNVTRGKYPDARYFHSPHPVDDLLDEATARVPLPPSLWYELVLLHRRPSGRLELTVQQLFLPEAVRGDRRRFLIRCAASDRSGTAFVVVARRAASSFEVVSVSCAQVPPGVYDVTATLLRPGQVRFDGLPVRPRKDTRNWLDIRAVLPDALTEIGPVHLIVAIERCGTAEVVGDRVEQAGRLISEVREGADGPVAISLVTYAAHSHNRRTNDEPVTVLAWQQEDGALLNRRLGALRDRAPASTLYQRAAPVECMLAEVSQRLRASGKTAGRLALAVIGNRPPFPHRIDLRSEIIPCPARRDWRVLLLGLAQERQGMAFGVIRDEGPDEDLDDPADDIWRRLGTDARADLAAFDPWSFAVSLGLLSPVPQFLPLPLAVPGGAD